MKLFIIEDYAVTYNSATGVLKIHSIDYQSVLSFYAMRENVPPGDEAWIAEKYIRENLIKK